jgi:small subunit ribosomal protein S6
MAKNKPDGLTHYELLYIVSNQFSEEELNPIKTKVEGIITEHEGNITHKESLGKKRLAYKIKQWRHGYYELVEFDAPSASLPAINDLLRLMSDVIRHQILKCVAKTAEQKQAEAKLISQLLSETASESAKKEDSSTPKTSAPKIRAPKIETKPVITPEAPTIKDEHKAELSDIDLDDKLNEILNTDSLL